MNGLIVEKLNIKYTYGVLAVSNLSFETSVGEIFAVLGGTEAGKTTLLKCIAGLENRWTGRILLNDRDILNVKTKERNACYVTSDGMFFKRRSVYYNLYYPLKIRKMSQSTAQETIRNALPKVGLGESILTKKISALSAVEKCKVALARCFLRNAEVYLIDDPLNQLNAEEREDNFKQLSDLLKELARSAIVIYATDNGDECRKLECKTVFLNYGIPIQYGEISDIIANPCSLTVLEKFYCDSKKENVILNADENPYIVFDGERVDLEREKLIDDIFIGKTVVAAQVNEKIKIYDAASERIIYFN